MSHVVTTTAQLHNQISNTIWDSMSIFLNIISDRCLYLFKCVAMTYMNKCNNKGNVYRNDEREVNKKNTISLHCSHRHTAIRPFGQEVEATCLTSPLFPFLLVNISSSSKTTFAEIVAWPVLQYTFCFTKYSYSGSALSDLCYDSQKKGEKRPKSWQVDAV